MTGAVDVPVFTTGEVTPTLVTPPPPLTVAQNKLLDPSVLRTWLDVPIAVGSVYVTDGPVADGENPVYPDVDPSKRKPVA
jgi:hypothetical protein